MADPIPKAGADVPPILGDPAGGTAGHGRATPAPMRHPGLVAGTLVMTAQGGVAVELLAQGDRIITRNTGMVPLKGLMFRQYRGDFLQVAAGAFDMTRPETDTIIAADQAVLLRGHPVHTDHGRAVQLIRAGDLAAFSGCGLLRGIEMTVVQMVFEAAQLVYADGLETLCLPEGEHSLAA